MVIGDGQFNSVLRKISPRFLHTAGVFVVGLLNAVRQIPPRPTPVAMATKFEIKFV